MQFAWEHVTRYQTPYLDLVGSPDSVTLSTACDIPGKFKIVPIICKKPNEEGVNMKIFKISSVSFGLKRLIGHTSTTSCIDNIPAYFSILLEL